ncbi:glycosyltransferase family 2 protein [Pseudodesulfovibrio sp. F-1]|uniref:Glycosyltransferase family 2 protein n=2 Tax=Pseudodesulfovibrio alkaliphilus TaxID=2661613 RepID=A0A7K1KLR2_9BACT|nr:glycosyltransferase family 2 protein [Pseudodesulfovibrio alkaliphilus]
MGVRTHISIIVSDQEAHTSLPRMLQSVARQSTGLDAVEILVIGTGSHASDAPQAWAAIADTGAVRLVESLPDTPAGEALNRAVECSSGRLLLFMRPDYRMDAKFLTTALSVFSEFPKADVMYADYIRIARDKGQGMRSGLVQLPDFDDTLLQTTNFLGPAVMLRRRTWERIHGFRDNTTYRFWDLWVQAATAGCSFFHVNYPLASCEVSNIPFRERAEDGRRKAMLVINNQAYFHMHTLRWAIAYLRGDAWAQAFGFMTIPDSIEVTRMMHEHVMRSMGTDTLLRKAIRQFDRATRQA